VIGQVLIQPADPLDTGEPGGRILGHGLGYRAVELNDRRRGELEQAVVQPADPLPVRGARIRSAGMFGRDGCLQGVRPPPADIDFAASQRAILVVEKDQVAGRVDAGGAAGVVQQHQPEQPGCLGFAGEDRPQDTTEPDRLSAQFPPDERVC
jgi:hypothetical protein